MNDKVTELNLEQKKTVNQYFGELEKLLNNAVQSGVRAGYLSNFQGTYDNADRLHHIYNDFGYPLNLEWSNFWNMFRRFGIASAVCETPVDFTWLEYPTVKSSNSTFNSEFEKLVKKLKLWKRLKGLDLRQRVGRYGGLYIRVKDGQQPDKEIGKINGVESIVSVTPLYEGQLTVQTSDNNQESERFDQPIMYQFNASVEGNRNEQASQSFNIHWSRIITAAEGADDGSIYGISSLENVYNDLMDLRKTCGAGGEGFYQNTRNAPVINTKDGYSAPQGKKKKEFEEQLDEFLNKWRKRFVAQGLEFDYPNIQLTDPKPFYESSLNNVAAGSKIPVKILIGAQTGKLAANEDSINYRAQMKSRQTNHANDIIDDFIKWCVDHNVLPEADYEIEWPDLLELSTNERITVSERMAGVNEKQFKAGGGPVFSEDEIREVAGYDPEELPIDTEELDEEELEPDASGDEPQRPHESSEE